MATMKQELTELKVRVERLEATIRRLTNDECHDSLSAPSESSDQEQCLTWLKAQGLIRDPTPEERRLAAEWDALPEGERRAHIRFMQSLILDPPLSLVITENRS